MTVDFAQKFHCVIAPFQLKPTEKGFVWIIGLYNVAIMWLEMARSL